MTGELPARVISALVLGMIALLAVYAGGWAFALLWLLGAIGVLAEWVYVTRVEPRLPIQVVLGAVMVLLTFLNRAEASLTAFVITSCGGIFAGAVLGRRSRDRFWSIAGFICAAVLCLLPPIVRDHPELGIVAVLWMFAVVWTTDVAAYFTGRRLGGPKLWPRVSPKKTWSGFLGGLAAGTLAGWLVALVAGRYGWTPPASLAVIALLSGVASVASQLGDLAESALKRSFDVKDSSHLIPGHGGVMDRLDGFWAVVVLVGIALVSSRLAA
jgi:phosphatidate cytidylyltransferase